MRRAPVEVCEHRLGLWRHMRRLVVRTVKPLTLSRVSNHIKVMNSTSWSRSRPTKSMERNPGMRRASQPPMPASKLKHLYLAIQT
jgi:hypothetical protein